MSEKTVTYEQLIAGALLKFCLIDNVDFSMLVEDFEIKTNTKVIGSWDYSPNGLLKYSDRCKNGTIKLKDNISLDHFIEEENRTLQEKLVEVAGNIVTAYFNGINLEEFKQKKEKILAENKDEILNNANLLLISDIQEDYDEIVNYGFKNIDHFKSIIRADHYFATHPEELAKYHIVLRGSQSVQQCNSEKTVELDRIIDNLGENHILEASLRRYDYSDHTEFVTYLSDSNNCKWWHAEEQTYTDIYDRIVENTFINHTLEKVGIKDKTFNTIPDYINPNRLPFPTKKSDLKILYLDPIRVYEYAGDIAKALGLNVTFLEDNNSSLGKHVKSNLGEYDIIIASDSYSSSLLGMNHESTEQSKDTGRELILLVTQRDFTLGVDEDLGDGIKLNYVFGGNGAPTSKEQNKQIKIFRHPIEVEAENEKWKKYSQSRYCIMKGIIESSVHLYNQALVQTGKPVLSDLDLKTAEELDQEYVEAYEAKKAVEEEEKAKREAELAPIRAFDEIKSAVLTYLKNRKIGLIHQFPKGLKITEKNDEITVEFIHERRSLGAITFSVQENQNSQKPIRIFKVTKGSLANLQVVGVYTSKYDNVEEIPKRPDEQQVKVLTAIEKKVNFALKPLNDAALNIRREFDNKTRLNLKNR